MSNTHVWVYLACLCIVDQATELGRPTLIMGGTDKMPAARRNSGRKREPSSPWELESAGLARPVAAMTMASVFQLCSLYRQLCQRPSRELLTLQPQTFLFWGFLD